MQLAKSRLVKSVRRVWCLVLRGVVEHVSQTKDTVFVRNDRYTLGDSDELVVALVSSLITPSGNGHCSWHSAIPTVVVE